MDNTDSADRDPIRAAAVPSPVGPDGHQEILCSCVLCGSDTLLSCVSFMRPGEPDQLVTSSGR